MSKFEHEKARLMDSLFCVNGHILSSVEVEGGRAFYCDICDEYYLPKSAGDFRTVSKMKDTKEIILVERVIAPVEAMTVSHTCPECGNTTAYRWTLQIGYADEEPHEFNMCTKCGHVDKHGWQL